MAWRNFLPASFASSSRPCSMSSRNFRNMIQVSIGRRSRSPFSPLSFRMMSRLDLTMLPSCCAVDFGTSIFVLRGVIRYRELRSVQEGLHLAHCGAHLLRAAEEGGYLRNRAALGDGRHFENFEIGRASCRESV